MTTPFGENGQGNAGGNDGGQPSGINPSWNEALSQIPSEYHNHLTPVFQKWDQNHQQGIQKVQSQYEPYNEFVQAGVDPEQIRVAMGIARVLEEDPRAVYEALAQDFGQQQPGNGEMNGQGPQAQGDQGDAGEFEGLPPEFMQRFQALEEQNNAMREVLMQQHQMTQQEKEDAELDGLYQDLSSKNETFAALNKDGMAEPYINSLLIAGYNAEQASDMFDKFVDAVLSYGNRPKPPTIMGAGGFMPERVVRPRDMSEQQTKQTMEDMLKAAFYGNQR